MPAKEYGDITGKLEKLTTANLIILIELLTLE